MKTRLMVVDPIRLNDWSPPPWRLLNEKGMGLEINTSINRGDLVFFLKEDPQGHGAFFKVFHPGSGAMGFLEAGLLRPVEDDE